MNAWDSTVTDALIVARLPYAGRSKFSFHSFIFSWLWDAFKRKDWRTVRYYLWVRRMRMANCETIGIGPFELFRPMPWLLGPARQLHPEAFHKAD